MTLASWVFLPVELGDRHLGQGTSVTFHSLICIFNFFNFPTLPNFCLFLFSFSPCQLPLCFQTRFPSRIFRNDFKLFVSFLSRLKAVRLRTFLYQPHLRVAHFDAQSHTHVITRSCLAVAPRQRKCGHLNLQTATHGKRQSRNRHRLRVSGRQKTVTVCAIVMQRPSGALAHHFFGWLVP